MTHCEESEKQVARILTRRDMLRYAGILSTAAVAEMLLCSYAQEAEAAGERIEAAPSRSSFRIGETIDFSGRLLNSVGKPIANAQIGVEDPIRQVSLIAGRTDGYGRFSYRVNGNYSAKAGQFAFRFLLYGSSISRQAMVTVSPVSARMRQMSQATNRGANRYQVDLTVDGRALGSRVILPGQSGVVLWDVSDSARHNLQMVCTNLSNQKRFVLTPATSGLICNSPTSCSVYNPTFASYGIGTNATVTNGTTRAESKSYTAASGGIYETLVNREWVLKNEKIGVGSSVKQGINWDAGISGGAQCSTFLGIRAECKVSCEASAGLELNVCAGLCLPVQPVHQLGCGASCGITFAEASCGVSASVGGQATYR